jgi:hypothetical protein
MDLMSLF